MQEITEFTNSQFNQTKSSILLKLKEELSELEVAKESGKHSDEVNEFIDCFHLMLDYASRLELNSNTLINLTDSKLEINKERDWNPPNEDGVIKHVEDGMDREIIEDILCDLIRDCMYKLADSGEYQIDLNYAIVSLISLAHRIQDGLVSNYDVVSAICGNRGESLGDMYKFADLVLSNDLMEIYRRHRGDPYAKGN